tara:strand:+ start:3013 stop:3273 length:261 start_codon:yes stop_codon:yes gene_type:complete
MKCDHSLNVSGDTTEEKFMVKCCAKNTTRNKPESAMATFLAMEEDTIPIMVFFSKIYDVQKYGSNVGMPNFSNAYRIIQIDSKNSY